LSSKDRAPIVRGWVGGAITKRVAPGLDTQGSFDPLRDASLGRSATVSEEDTREAHDVSIATLAEPSPSVERRETSTS